MGFESYLYSHLHIFSSVFILFTLLDLMMIINSLLNTKSDPIQFVHHNLITTSVYLTIYPFPRPPNTYVILWCKLIYPQKPK